jgi:hypothetical protein
MEHGRITGNDCDADSMDSFAHPVNPGICTKYAEEPRQVEIGAFECRWQGQTDSCSSATDAWSMVLSIV